MDSEGALLSYYLPGVLVFTWSSAQLVVNDTSKSGRHDYLSIQAIYEEVVYCFRKPWFNNQPS